MAYKKKMSLAILLSILFMINYACTQDSGLSIDVDERMGNQKLVFILNNAQITELNKLNPGIQKTLSLKIYKIPYSGSCVPETHLTCGYDYYLAVSEFDEMPNQAVWHLGKVGEITDFQWLKPDENDKALLKFKVLNYSQLALERNKNLLKKEKTLTLSIRVDALRIRKTE